MSTNKNSSKYIPVRTFGKWIDLIFALFLVLILPYLSGISADILYPKIQKFDSDETFIWLTVHHVAQLLLTVVVMLWLGRSSLKKWGFNFKNLKLSLIFILAFLVIFGVYKFFQLQAYAPIDYSYPLTLRNMLGVQGFQYLLSGLGEEPLFRRLIMTFLATRWRRVYKFLGLEIPQTILIATAFFMLAHLDINLLELTVSGFDLEQQIKSFQLGIFYGLIFHYTKSLFAPVTVHGLSNGLLFSIGYYFS